MPIQTGPNVIVDISTDISPVGQWGVFEGTAGDVFVWFNRGSGALGRIEIWRAATLAGTTWALVFSFTSSSGGFIPEACAFDKVSKTFLCCWFQQGDSTVQLGTYNADTAASTTVNLTPTLGASLTSMAVGRLADGTIGIALKPPSTGLIKFVTYDGVSFSSVFTVPGSGALLTLRQYEAMPVSGSKFYLLWRTILTSTTQCSVIDSGVASTATNITVSGGAPSNTGQVEAVFGGLLFVCVFDKVFRSTDAAASAFVLSQPPGWGASATLMTDGVNLYATHTILAFDGGGALIQDQMVINTYLGSDTWGPDVVIADFIADPPPFVPPGDYETGSHASSPSLMSDGTFGIAVNFWGPDHNDLCVPFYVGATAVAPLVLDCGDPPAGTVGTPYSHTFPVTGGVPPYTFAITAGSLPPGLELDEDTGEVSGTPTYAGVYTFTVQVTDSADTTDDVECSITINGGPVHLRITLLGVKRYPERPSTPGETKVEKPEPPAPKTVKGPGYPGGGAPL